MAAPVISGGSPAVSGGAPLISGPPPPLPQGIRAGHRLHVAAQHAAAFRRTHARGLRHRRARHAGPGGGERPLVAGTGKGRGEMPHWLPQPEKGRTKGVIDCGYRKKAWLSASLAAGTRKGLGEAPHWLPASEEGGTNPPVAFPSAWMRLGAAGCSAPLRR